jgi:hypothetical protein
MILGTLLYSVVLGFFNDYTDILSTKSYSTTFAVAIVMQLLTYGTFLLKDIVVTKLKQKENVKRVYIAFSIWLIMFLSKFIFLAVLDVIFGNNIEISGFVGLLLIIICLTIAQKVVEYIDKKLGSHTVQ